MPACACAYAAYACACISMLACMCAYGLKVWLADWRKAALQALKAAQEAEQTAFLQMKPSVPWGMNAVGHRLEASFQVCCVWE